ncbi:MAG: hypothetical protein KIS81_10465 [Maricaulaceae bacterium]|nr:hypothetical protein [Maricaulaceae bacterium]
MTDRITLTGRAAWQQVHIGGAGGSQSSTGLAASEIGLRRRFWQGTRWVFSGQLKAVIPGSGENVAVHPLGEGGYGAEARLLAARSVGTRSFVDAQAGYRWRSTGYPSEARLDLTAGWRPRERILLLAQSFSVFGEPDVRLQGRSYRRHTFQGSAVWERGAYALQIGGFFTFAGRDAIEERAALVAVWRRF